MIAIAAAAIVFDIRDVVVVAAVVVECTTTVIMMISMILAMVLPPMAPSKTVRLMVVVWSISVLRLWILQGLNQAES